MRYLKYIEAIAAILLVVVDLAKHLVPEFVRFGTETWAALRETAERVKKIWQEAGQCSDN